MNRSAAYAIGLCVGMVTSTVWAVGVMHRSLALVCVAATLSGLAIGCISFFDSQRK